MNQLKTPRIGIFDTGRGGQIVAQLLKPFFPNAEFMVVDDTKNAPYGAREAEEIIELSIAAVQPLIVNSCNPIIIACNTASTNTLRKLQKEYLPKHFPE
jgi:glutamate racemase